jgi:uncharacterized Fe-S cluster protein YjdI
MSELSEEIKEYSNGEITVIWQPGKCKHSGVCALGLPQVFKPKEKPWIKIHSASTQQIKAQVDRCPSGALSWKSADPT